jgi:hypothetical protein
MLLLLEDEALSVPAPPKLDLVKGQKFERSKLQNTGRSKAFLLAFAGIPERIGHDPTTPHAVIVRAVQMAMQP